MSPTTLQRMEVAGLAAVLSFGVALGSTKAIVNEKLDAARFVADSITRTGAEHARDARAARADSLLIEVQADVRALVCDQYPRYPKCRSTR